MVRNNAVHKRCTAYHEAGHSVLSYRLDFYSGEVTIKPDDTFGLKGVSKGEAISLDRNRDADYIKTLFAGYIAQKRYDHDANAIGSSRDNEEAAELLQGHPELSEQDLRQETESLVTKYWPEIEAVAAALINDTTLSGEEMSIICDAIEEEKDWQEVLSKYRQLRKYYPQ